MYYVHYDLGIGFTDRLEFLGKLIIDPGEVLDYLMLGMIPFITTTKSKE